MLYCDVHSHIVGKKKREGGEKGGEGKDKGREGEMAGEGERERREMERGGRMRGGVVKRRREYTVLHLSVTV